MNLIFLFFFLHPPFFYDCIFSFFSQQQVTNSQSRTAIAIMPPLFVFAVTAEQKLTHRMHEVASESEHNIQVCYLVICHCHCHCYCYCYCYCYCRVHCLLSKIIRNLPFYAIIYSFS
jgi:hypothetical protein